MQERLIRKGFDNNQINTTMKFLANAGLISDDVLATQLFRSAVERKHLGRKGIKMFLYKRGIEKELIDKALTAHSGETDEKTALKFVEKKLKILKNQPENVVRRRLWGMLQRRGFSADVIYKAVKSIGNKKP